MTTPHETTVDITDASELIDELAALAQEQAAAPEPMAAGTFVMYPMPDGGVMFVTSVDHGPMAGIRHSRIPPGMIRAVGIIASGGSKMQALKALGGFGRKAIERGE